MYMNKHSFFFLLNEFKSFTLDFYILQRVLQNLYHQIEHWYLMVAKHCRVIRKEVDNEIVVEGEASLS